MSFSRQVYEAVKRIKPGQVKTYGQIAREVATKDARRVGQILHANKDPEVPCHRVVFADGSLAPGYAFGGRDEQIRRLKTEKVRFRGNKVDLLISGQIAGGMIKSVDL